MSWHPNCILHVQVGGVIDSADCPSKVEAVGRKDNLSEAIPRDLDHGTVAHRIDEVVCDIMRLETSRCSVQASEWNNMEGL